MLPDLSLVELLAAAGVAAAGAFVQGATGFGLSLIAVPFLILIDIRFVPGPLLLSAIILTVTMAVRGRDKIQVKGIAWAIAGRVPGVLAGAAVLAVLPRSELSVLFSALVLIGVAMTASGLELRPTGMTLLLAGALSGFMGTAASLGGPPLALVYQRHPGPELRSTLAGYFVVGGIMSATAVALVGKLGRDEILLAVVLVPGLIVGYLLSARLTGWLDRGRTRAAVLVVSAVSAVLALVQQLG